jgi:hypothetical protein
MVTPLPALDAIRGFIDPRRATLLGLASGLAQGNDWGEGMGLGFARAAQGRVQDDAFATAKKEEAERAKQLNYTIQAFQKAGRQDLVERAQAGFMQEAWNEFSKPKASPLEINGQLVDPTTYQVLGDFRDPEVPKSPTIPAGYRTGADGMSFEPVPGGPADPNNPLNARKGGATNPTLQKEIFETDESLQAGQNVLQSLTKALELNNVAWDGPLADARSAAASLTGNQEAVATQELKNIVTSNALESLKAIFGGMPTEGERKILLEVQGSVDQPKAVREKIFKRALAAAERRNAFNKQKADALRSGDYFDEGFSPVSGPGADVEDLVNKYLTGQ